MKRIVTLLSESEAIAARKAVCVAGAQYVVITPIPSHPYFVEPSHRDHSSMPMQVRFEVRADERHYGDIVSAIKRLALVKRHGSPSFKDSFTGCLK